MVDRHTKYIIKNRFGMTIGVVLSMMYWLWSPLDVHGQIKVNVSNTLDRTPEALVREVLLGNGVEILSVKTIGSIKSIGKFDNALMDIGINKGIVLSTGSVSSIARPNDRGDTGDSPDPNAIQTDADLQRLTPYPIKEVTGLEIEFQSQTEFLEFRYVFASEEYPEFTCSKFNDIFAFLVTGPKPGGGKYDRENIALVPDPNDPSGDTFTNYPVWTNTVNNGKVGDIPSDGNCTDPNESLAFTQYYNDNTNSTTFTFDGYLDIFKSKIEVLPCQVYKIKLIIGDSNDFDYDSAVFLEANSLNSRAYSYLLESSSKNLVEGCKTGHIGIKYSQAVSELTEIPLRILSAGKDMAQKGVDYELSSETFLLNSGDSIAYIDIISIEDGAIETTEFIRIIDVANGCTIDTFTISISDSGLETKLKEITDQSLCPEGATLSSLVGELSSPTYEFHSNEGNYAINEGYDSVINIPINTSGINIPLMYSPLADICLIGLSHPKLSELGVLLKSPWGQVVRIAESGVLNQVAMNSTVCLSEKLDFTSINEKLQTNHSFNGIWELIIVDEVKNANRGSLNSWSLVFDNLNALIFTFTDSANQVIDINTVIDNDTRLRVEVSDQNGCAGVKNIDITIVEDISQQIMLSCEVIDRDQIEFKWIYSEDVEFEVKVGADSEWLNVGKRKSYVVPDLPPDQLIEFGIRPILGNCNGPSSNVTCTTPSCTVPDINVVSIGQSTNACEPNGFFEISSITTKGPYRYFVNNEEKAKGLIEYLAQGQYLVELMDGYGCKATTEINIDGLSSMAISAFTESALCGQDGYIDIFVSGGAPPYSYRWSTGSMEKDANGLQGGVYTITVTDAQDCKVIKTFELIQSDRLKVVNPMISNVSCHGAADGQVEVSISGGLPPYTTLIRNKNDSTLYDQNSLPAGEYRLIVMDDNQCKVESNVIVSQPRKIEVIADVVASTCSSANDGIIKLNINGGNEPYTILWEDDNTSVVRRHLSAGSYAISISDNELCSITTTVEVPGIEDPQVSIKKKDISCFGSEDGAIDISILNMEFDVTWSDANANKSRDFLKTGMYCASIEAATGCTIDTCIVLSQPNDLTIKIDIKNNLCFGIEDGEINIAVLDGKGPYELSLGEMNVTHDSIFKIEKLAGGNYDLRIKQSNGCEKAIAFNIASASRVERNITARDISCYSGDNGSIELNYSGLVEPVEINWIGPDKFSSGLLEINELKAGTYDYTLIDANGCEYRDKVNLSQPDEPLIADVKVSDITCFGSNDGIINATLNGGSGQYSFAVNSKDNYSTAGLFMGLGPGSYDLFARDELDCTIEIPDLLVVEPMKFIINLEVDTEVYDFQEVPIDVVVLNPQGEYVLSWESDPAEDLPCVNCQTTIITNIERNLFLAVSATDEKGCKAYDEKKIFVRRANHISVPSAFTPNNDSMNDKLFVYGTNGASILDFAVFNRDGVLLFSSSGFKANENSIGWDGIYKGRDLPAGAYIWTVTAQFMDNSQLKFSGVTQLIR